VNAIGAGSPAFARIDVAPLSLARLSGHAGRWNLVALEPLRGLFAPLRARPSFADKSSAAR
jgi:hypothetical protein